MTPKFRAWLLAEKKMVRVSAITFFSIGKLEGKVMEILYLSESHNRFVKIWAKDPERFVLMQSTGLKDINGKEIYEGDVLKVSSGRMFDIDEENPFIVVKWDEESGAYTTKDFTGEFDVLNLGWQIADELIRVEVIGNIYENPELVSEFEEEVKIKWKN